MHTASFGLRLLSAFAMLPSAVLLARPVDVTTLGADPAGERDSTAAIQSALDQGGAILFPRGTYRITKTLHITKSGTCLRGEHGATIYLAPGEVRTALSARTSDENIWKVRDIRIEGLTLRNDPANYQSKFNAGRGIGLHGVVNASIDKCRIESFVHDGIAISICKNVVVSETRVVGGRHGINLWGHYQSGRWGNWNVQIDNCHVSDTWDTGIVICYFSRQVTVSHCIVERSKCHGVDIFHAFDVTLSGNVVKNWLDLSVKAGGKPEQAVGVFIHTDQAPDVPTSNIVVTGNTIVHAPHGPGTRPVCLEVRGNVEAVSITGNAIIGGACALAAGPTGRREDSAKHPDWTPRDILFANNVCRGQSGAWLYLNGYDQEMSLLITGNLFAPKDGVCFLDPTMSGPVFSGNLFRSGQFAKSIPKGITWGRNYVGKKVGNPPPGDG